MLHCILAQETIVFFFEEETFSIIQESCKNYSKSEGCEKVKDWIFMDFVIDIFSFSCFWISNSEHTLTMKKGQSFIGQTVCL